MCWTRRSLLLTYYVSTESDVSSTLDPIGADCYEVHPSDSALLEAKDTIESSAVKGFQSLVGSLLLVARCTRPDIVFAVHKATRQTYKPRLHYWKPGKRVARYLKGTQTMKLNIRPNDN